MAEFPFEEKEIEVVQSRKIKRLELRNVFDAILQAFNLERGGIYTVKQLLLDPGEMVRRYISTGRLNFTSPFKLLIITTTVVFLLLQQSASFQEFREGFFVGLKNSEIQNFIDEASRYFNLLLWIYIPIGALITWGFNYKGKFNYAENLAYQTYLFSLTNIIMMFMVIDVIVPSVFVLLTVYIAFIFYYYFSYKSFFQKGWLRTILEQTLIYLISSTIYFIVLIGIAMFYLKLNGRT
jgi:hypothetical protein